MREEVGVEMVVSEEEGVRMGEEEEAGEGVEEGV